MLHCGMRGAWRGLPQCCRPGAGHAADAGPDQVLPMVALRRRRSWLALGIRCVVVGNGTGAAAHVVGVARVQILVAMVAVPMLAHAFALRTLLDLGAFVPAGLGPLLVAWLPGIAALARPGLVAAHAGAAGHAAVR